MMKRVLTVTAMLTLGMVLPRSATADPIRITGGSAVVDEIGFVTVDIRGPQGFHAQFRNGVINTNGPWVCGLLGPCPPGAILSPSGFVESIDGAGTVEFRGVSYRLGATSIGLGEAVISMRPSGAAFIVPPFGSRPFILRTPFELPSITGSHFEFTLGEDQFIDLPLTGKGMFTMELMPQLNGEPFWQLAQVRYDFAPTPEPGALVLLTTGLGTLAVQRRRRHSQK